MTMTTTKATIMAHLELTGDTYQQREYLRAHGWSWSQRGKCWVKDAEIPRGIAYGTEYGIGDEHDPRVAAAKAVHGNRPGCALWAGAQLIWAAKNDSHRALYMRSAPALALHEQEIHDR